MYKKIGSGRFGGGGDDMSSDLLHSSGGLGDVRSDLVLHEPAVADGAAFGSGEAAAAAPPKPRVRSLDAFRGLVMVVMIFVDDTGFSYGGHWDHSPWDGITFADFVMPSFLFIVGVSMVFANQSKNVEGQRWSLFSTVFFRCVRLFLMGIFVQGAQNFGTPYDLYTLRIPGILQRIAFAQLIVTMFELLLPVRDVGYEDNTSFGRYYRRYAWHWLACGATLLVYALLMYTTPVPGCPLGSATPECNAAGYWDRKILGVNHMYGDPTYRRLPACSSCSPCECPRADAPAWCNVPFDPEGSVASLAAVGSLFFGAFVGHVLMDTKGNFAERSKQTLVYGTALVTVGLSAHFAGIPMNKNLFSLSYILFMGGTATVLLLLFDLVVDQWQVEKPFLPLIWMGMNPMLVFVMAASGVWEQLFQWVYYQQPQNNLVDWLRTTVLVGKYGIDGGTMFYTWIKITFWVIVTGVCAYKKIFIKI